MGTAGAAGAVLMSAALLGTGCRGPGAPGASSALGVRLVSLHDVTTDALVRLGAASRLVGVSEPVSVAADVRAAIIGVPRVAGAESIVAVRPTAVVGLGVVADQSPELVDALQRRGIDVSLARPRTLDDVYGLVRAVARLAGVGATAAPLIARAEARAAAASRERPAGAARRVFVYDCCDPPFTTGGATVLSDVIGHAGARNIFADLPSAWTHVSWEQVVAREPQLIVIDDYPGEGDKPDAGATGAGLGRKRAALAAIPSLARVPTLVLPLSLSLGGLPSVEALERLQPVIAGLGG